MFSTPNDSLQKFFERPIVTNTYTWTPLQGAMFTANFDPWTAFFNNPRVINRVNNYGLMRANLHVRFLINGNAFYYGRLMCDYAPLRTNDDVTAYATISSDYLVSASQRMKVFIDPAMSCSCELYLPFVYYKDAISPISAEWAQLGRVYMREVNGLKHANAANQPLTITVMMWATEVELAIPTSANSSALVAQAGEDMPAKAGTTTGGGDEYGKNPVSGPATAVANLAKTLTDLPIIGPYARATSMAAGGVASLAKAFGLSRPAIIDPPVPMTPYWVSDLAPADAGDMAAKLTVDTKQELTIDPNIIGIDLPDELSVAHIGARESYLTTFNWATTKVAGDLLWNAYVTPNVTRYALPNYFPPACCFAVQPFLHWRGKMRYRFQIVASGYHRGRLRIVWDPLYIASLEANVQLTTVVDITDSKEIVVEIDWGQAQHYLDVGGLVNSNSRHTTAAIVAGDSTKYNGVIGVYVLNDLATPNSVANNDIQVNVYVSTTDLQVCEPGPLGSTWTNPYGYVQQAGEEDMPVDEVAAGCGDPVPEFQMGVDGTDDNELLVYFGERITSFRQLLKRYVNHSSYVYANTSATNHAVVRLTLPNFPNYYGYNAQTLHTTTVGGFKFNYVHPTIMNYLAPAFVCQRGSLRTKYVASSSSPNDLVAMTVERGFQGTLLPAAVTALPVTSQSNYARAARINKLTGANGAVTTAASKRPVIEVEFPYYKSVRFDEARIMNALNLIDTNPQLDGHVLELHLAPGTNTVAIDRFVAAGEDFSLFWFQGCPAISILAAPA